MTREPVNLSRATRTHLARLPADTPIAHVARLQDGPAVAVCVPDAVPAGVLLPPGLQWAPSPDTTASDLCAAAEPDAASNRDGGTTDLRPFVALRFRSVLQCPSADPAAAARRLARASLVAVAGAVLAEGATLGDVTDVRGAGSPVRVDVYEAAGTRPDAGEDGMPVAPAARPAEASGSGTTRVRIDVLAYLSPDATRQTVLDALSDGVRAQAEAASRLAPVRASVGHFAVLGAGLCVTFVWGDSGCGDDDMESVARRKAVHGALCLPQDRPLLRSGCRAFCGGGEEAGSEKDGAGRLVDVHVGMKGHGLGGAVSEHLVDGSYAYCHYRQDRFDDSGWGCAYRSLQTIASWAARQGYASGAVPGHRAIQQALVAVGDKPASFAGSREWIGANEVCYALQRLIGLDSRIVHVPSGSEMGSRGRELARHFDEHGSPVMVGGGVLAWTILGVARDERTGKTRFLILDPHYEGRDERAAVQAKGWVAWKDDSIFRADSFYNLCMPLRPSGV